MAVGENGALWVWGKGSYGQLGLVETNDRQVPTLVGAEDVFGGSKVRTIACGYDHTLAVTEAGELWACGRGAQGRLGLNDEQRRPCAGPSCAIVCHRMPNRGLIPAGVAPPTWRRLNRFVHCC
jgi:alpha-tubulin suppressor-like RCC1 family protein